MSKLAKNDLVSIYKLEFYKRKKKWIIPSKASKGSKKDKKQLEKKLSEGKFTDESKDPDLVIDEQDIRDLNRTYSVDSMDNKSTLNEAFIESGSGNTAIDSEDIESTESPKLIIERTEPVVNFKIFWPQLMLTGLTDKTDILDSNYCFNPYDYKDGDFIDNIKRSTEHIDFNANIEKPKDIVNQNARHYDNGDHEFVNDRFVKNRQVSGNYDFMTQESEFEKALDNIFSPQGLESQSLNDYCFYQYGNVVTNEGMYFESGYEKEELKIVHDENYLQNVLMQINNEVTTAEGRVLDELGSCSSLNTLRFMEGARRAPHSSEIDLYDVNKDQMCLSDRTAMEKYNQAIQDEQLLGQNANNKKRQPEDTYLWNNINNGGTQETNEHHPPIVNSINVNSINVEATNQLSKLLLGSNNQTNTQETDNPNVTIVRNKENSFNANKTLIYKKFPKLPFENQNPKKNYENLKNYPSPSDLFDDNLPEYASVSDKVSKSRRIYDDGDITGYVDNCSLKNMFVYLNNAKTSSNVDQTGDLNNLPKLNSAPSSVGGQTQNWNMFTKNSNDHAQNSNNPQNSNKFLPNSNNYPHNSNNYPLVSNKHPHNPTNYLPNPSNYPQNPKNYPQNPNNYLQNKNSRNPNNNLSNFETDVAPYKNKIHHERPYTVYSDNISIQCHRVTNNTRIPFPNLSIPPPNLNNTAPNMNNIPPKLDLPLPNQIPPTNSNVDIQAVNFRWSMDSAPADYFENIHHSMVGCPPNAPCFLSTIPKGRGRGRLMKS